VDYIGNPIPDSVASITGLAMEYRGTAQFAARNEADIVRTSADILSFTIPDSTENVTIDPVNHTINVQLYYGVQLTGLVPEITTSIGATVDPASGVAQTFSETTPVTYTVTAEDGTTTQTWDVTVSFGANDTEAPAFRTPFPIIKNIGSSSFDIAVQLDEPSVVYYIVDTVTAAGPSIAEIMAAGNSFDVDADSVTVNETVSDHLTPGGEYKVYIIAEDKFITPNVQSDSVVFDVTMNPAVGTTDLIFSEYIEGSSSNKAIEIYNGTGADVDLSGYSVKLAPNGGAWGNTLNLTGTLAAGDVFVIANASADQVIQDVADATSNVTYFNGNDALGLFKGADSIDVIGVQGTDPGTAWDVAGVANATLDHPLVRKRTVTQGQTDWALSAGTNTDDSEWEVYDQNTFSFLGYHGIVVGNVPPEIGYINIDPTMPEVTDPVSVSVKVVDNDGIVTDVKLMYGTAADTYDNEIAMTDDNNDSVYMTVSDIPAQVAGTTVYLKVVATDDNMDSSERTYSYGIPVEASIYEIQFTSADPADSPLKGSRVITSGIVTADMSQGFFIQDSAKAWNGVYVYDYGDNAVNIGDSVTFTATVDEYNTLTELKNLSSFNLVSGNNTVPTPVEITPGDVDEANESVLVKLTDVICTNTDAGHGMWEVTDGIDTIYIDDEMFAYNPVKGGVYNITGICYNSFFEWKVLPRSAADIDTVSLPANEAPVIDNVTITPDAPTTADDVVVTFTVTDDVSVVADSIHFYYGTTEGDYANEGTLVPDGFDASKFSVTIPAQDAGTVYFKITAADGNLDDPKVTEYTGSYDVVTVGINQLSLDNAISIYPNPSAGHFTLSVEKVVNGKVSVEVTDIQGRMILQKQFTTNNSLKTGIDLGSKGVYILKVTTGNAFSVQRIVVR
ncbi:MAG TPA: T9SS type A sorting domain-containing protein, partial [Bacteroidales bacterium]|nr:T9SS type A sorting domain-containing protein [Bacteroidales bacterium]